MAQEYPKFEFPVIRYFIGDVDLKRIKRSINEIDYLFNATIIKLLNIAENNPVECINKAIEYKLFSTVSSLK